MHSKVCWSYWITKACLSPIVFGKYFRGKPNVMLTIMPFPMTVKHILSSGHQQSPFTVFHIGCFSVSQSCPTLCDPMDCSIPGFLVLHHLPELAQTHVHWVGDTIQPSHLLSSPSPGFNLSQHQGLFQWISCSHQVAKILELQPQPQSFQSFFHIVEILYPFLLSSVSKDLPWQSLEIYQLPWNWRKKVEKYQPFSLRKPQCP